MLTAARGPAKGVDVRRGGRSRIVGQVLHPQLVQLGQGIELVQEEVREP